MDELKQTITRYLLGELSEREQAALEKSYVTDPQVSDQVLKTESELVDGYVRDQLSREVRERFERSYMAHPARRQRVKFARALATRLDGIEAPVIAGEQSPSPVTRWQGLLRSLRGQRPMLSFSIALATLLVMLGGVWIFVESRRRQADSAQTAAAREAEEQQHQRERSQQTANQGSPAESPSAQQAAVGSNSQPIPPPTPTPTIKPAPHTVTLALAVGGVRGGEGNQIPTLVILPGTTQARLLLSLKEDNYPSYHASLQTIAGVEVFSRSVKSVGEKTGAGFVFTVPAHKFAGGDYVLTLRGINPDGEADNLTKSLFRVVKR